MIGGGKEKLKTECSGMPWHYLFLASLFAIFIKTYMVQWSYNNIWPKLVKNSGVNNYKFNPLTFNETFVVIILFWSIQL